MIVTRLNFFAIRDSLTKAGSYGLDTETTGLSIEDRPFSLQITDNLNTYYFNFNDRPDHLGGRPDEIQVLPQEWWKELQTVFDNPDSTWFAHNALFDMRMLGYFDLNIKGRVHCTMGNARLLDNSLMRYSLDACLKRIGLSKNDKVAEYVKKNKLYTMKELPGRKTKRKFVHYEQVPFNIMVEYGEQDSEDVLELGLYQTNTYVPAPSRAGMGIDEMESKLLHVVHDMNQVGIKIDRNYTSEQIIEGHNRVKTIKEEIGAIAGQDFRPGPLWLCSVLDGWGIEYPKNKATGNPVFSKDNLKKIQHPIVEKILELRHEEKFLGTYFHSFAHYSDPDCILYSYAHPGGTDTGRFSYSSPNLQNIPKVEHGPDPRRCFIPREGYQFLMVDYKQQEYRLMLDYAGDTQLIKKVNNGMDVHSATAELLHVDRKTAKTLNFMLLYGGGAQKLADALGKPLSEAITLRNLYFARLPRVDNLIRHVIKKGKAKGYIYNWAGRILRPKSREESYKLPNYLIQSSGADVIKHAMIKIHELLDGYLSRILLTVHDELIFEIHDDEHWVIPKIVDIMENVYVPFNGVRLECDASTSNKSWSENDKCEYVVPENIP